HETLGSQAVLMFAKKVFVQIERKTQCIHQDQIRDCIAGDLEIFELRDTLGKIAQSRRNSRAQQEDGDTRSEKIIPEDQPVTAFKIGVGLFSLITRHAIKPSLCRRGWIEWFNVPKHRGRAVARGRDLGSGSKGVNLIGS